MKKRLLSVLLLVVLVLSLFPTAALAATVDNTCQPGTYTASAPGRNNKPVTVTLTLSQQDDTVVISDLQADGSTQTPDYWVIVEESDLLADIKEANGTDGVDTVSGATQSSRAVLNAVDKALAQATAAFSGGTGTQDDPYLISSEAGLRYLQAQVANGTTYAGQYIKLTSDITLTDEWTPIGSSGTLAFGGTFDGDGHSISGMTITAATSYIGLFGYTLNGVAIRNVNLENVSISISNAAQNVYAGALVAFIKNDASGTASSVIDGCTASGSISVTTANKIAVVGGLAGFTDQRAAITNCGANVTILADSGTGRATVGGLTAWASIRTLFMNNYVLGNVSVTTTNTSYGNVGGAFGQVNGIVYNLYTAGRVTLTSPDSTTYKPGAIAGDLTTATYADSCYYVSDAEAFGAANGKSNSATIAKKTAADVASEEFAQLLHNNLAPGALAAMAANVETAAISGCDDFSDMTARVKNAFLDWIVSGSKVVLADSLWSSSEADASIFASGDGTEATPYLIETEAQLRAFAASLTSKIDYTDKYVALANDIDASSRDWTPIGGSDYLFNGTFDGRGHAIDGLTLGAEDKPFALDKENLYIGLFGILGSNSVVKNVNLTNVAFYTTYEATAFLGGIAGVTQGSTASGSFTGALIDSCSVSGAFYLNNTRGNHFVGGLVGMQYKGATINSHVSIRAAGIVDSGDLAEVGGLAGINNRGLIANCWTDNDLLYASGNRENGNEGMAVVSNLVACNAGALVNCYASGDLSTREFSTYAGMVSGWVTGIGKSYTCWYDLDSTVINGAETDNPVVMNPVAPIGTKVASGVTEEGDIYTGGLVDRMTPYDADGYAAIADGLNAAFAAFPIDITPYGIGFSDLKTWIYDAEKNLVTFGDQSATGAYVQPDCEKVEKPEQSMQDGIWYGRDADKTTVVKITVQDNAITSTEVLSGEDAGEACEAALAKARYKATYGDFSHYDPADPTRFAGGSGTENDPYRIANEAQLRYLAESINADVDWNGVFFQQTASIQLTGGDWLSIGWSLNGEVNGKKTLICAYPFRGNYDGGDHTITGMTLGSAEAPADCMTTGLFGLTSGSLSTNDLPSETDQLVRLKNIHLRDIDVHVATRYETFAGGLVGSGQNGIFIDNCSVTGVIDSTTTESFCRAGGLAASVLRGAVTNCWTDVDVSGVTDTNNVYAGALYGMDNRVTTVNCCTLGNVTGCSTNPSKVYIGGLAGQGGGIHLNCYSAGDIVSRQVTGDVGILNGRSAGISVQYNSYFNTDALLQQGSTVIAPAKAVGTITTNATETNVDGKTANELRSRDFAAQLNRNITASSLNAAMEDILKTLTRQDGNGYTQQNYYEGNKLLSWTVKNDTVIFGSESSGGSTGGGGGGSVTASCIITVEAPANGAVSPSGRVSVREGASQSFTFTPNSGYAVSDVLVDGKSVGAVSSYTFKNVTASHTLKVTFAPAGQTPAALPFTDVTTGSWYHDDVAWAYENGLMNGTNAASFSPSLTTTRAMIVTILYRLENQPAVSAACPFTDVAAGSYYEKAVTWAASNGIVTGYSAGTFGPNDPITREQLAAILYRYAQYKGRDVSAAETALAAYTDASSVSAYAVPALCWACSEGIVNGTSAATLTPQGSATRAQVAVMLHRLTGLLAG